MVAGTTGIVTLNVNSIVQKRTWWADEHAQNSHNLSGRISREEFLREYRDPDNYRVEHPGRNRSHTDEGG